MRDRDDGPRVLVEEPLEPLDRLGVEVVRGLIEQEQVGVLQKQPAEGHASLLAAGERRDLGVVRRTAKGVHRDLDVALDIPCADRVDPVLERGLFRADGLVVGIRVRPFGHHRVVLLDQAVDFADAVEHVLLDVLGRVELRLLAEIANGEAGRQACLAVVPVIEAGHDPQQARLARAVWPDDADLGARVERDGDVLEHRPVRRIVPRQLVRGVDELGRHLCREGYRDGRPERQQWSTRTQSFLNG